MNKILSKIKEHSQNKVAAQVQSKNKVGAQIQSIKVYKVYKVQTDIWYISYK